MPDSCPTAEELELLLGEQLSEPEQATLSLHLDGCNACRRRLEKLAEGPSWLRSAARQPNPGSETATGKLEELIKQFQTQGPSTRKAQAVGIHFLRPSEKPGVLGQLGAYEVLEEIDRGGMGIVFKARDTTLDRIVAIKALAPALAHDPVARARFLREARAAAAIAHEHVVTIHAVEETGEVPYLVMQCVQGRSLRERLSASGPLSVSEVLRIGGEIAAGLAAAHRLGLVHRDIKPSNILLEGPDERVKITDFGLARAVNDAAITSVGQIAGTPEYMAPEQARGEAVDQRADLFSLGTVLYEMATGSSPFRAPTSLAALRKVCDETCQPAHLVRPSVPEWLGETIATLLAKDPADRRFSAAELSAYLRQSGPHRAHRMHHRRSGGLYWAAGAAAAILLGAVWWIADHPRQLDSSAPSDAFVLMRGGATERFSTLAAAVAGAESGGVIEFRFNGEKTMPPLVLEGKALGLRAATGFKPVWVSSSGSEPLLRTRAPLLIEGLTFKASAAHFNVSRPEDRAAGPGTGDRPRRDAVVMFVESTGGAVMAANCEFLSLAQPSAEMPKGPTAIRLNDAPDCYFENCAFVGPSGRAFECRASNTAKDARLSIRNCVQSGSELCSILGGSRVVTLELTQNTAVGRTLVHAPPPLVVHASRNVFDVEALHHRDPRAPQKPLTDVLRWQGGENVFAVRRAFAHHGVLDQPDASPLTVTTFEAWTNALKLAGDSSITARLGLFARFQNRARGPDYFSPADFRLTREEHKALSQHGPVGADFRIVGADGYASWKANPRYREWLNLARQQGFSLE